MPSKNPGGGPREILAAWISSFRSAQERFHGGFRLPRLSARSGPRNKPCWVCGGAVEPASDPQETNHQDTLGGPFSFPACGDCRRHRGTTPARLAQIIVNLRTEYGAFAPIEGHWDLDDRQTDELEKILSFSDADGARCGTAIHVRDGDRYVPLREWMQTRGHSEALIAARIVFVETSAGPAAGTS